MDHGDVDCDVDGQSESDKHLHSWKLARKRKRVVPGSQLVSEARAWYLQQLEVSVFPSAVGCFGVDRVGSKTHLPLPNLADERRPDSHRR